MKTFKQWKKARTKKQGYGRKFDVKPPPKSPVAKHGSMMRPVYERSIMKTFKQWTEEKEAPKEESKEAPKKDKKKKAKKECDDKKCPCS